MTVECPHCKTVSEIPAIGSINIAQRPEMRESVQDLSCFRVTCPNCGETMLVVQPCLYHDVENRFMVWLWTDEEQPPHAQFDPLAGYTLRLTDTMNAFREKINVLEMGLDDRAVELMKLLLYMRLKHDLDVVELCFHEIDRVTGEFRFVAVLSDGVEQYAAMPGELYMRLKQDVDERIFTPGGDFVRIDIAWAAEMMSLLQGAEE